MKQLLAVLALTMAYVAAALAVEPVVYKATIIRVIDGDTVVIPATYLPQPLKQEISIRVFGVDTPEKGFRAKCPEEDAKGKEATEFTKAAVAKAKKVEVALHAWDKYGGRVLGDVILDRVSLRDMLINKGFARAYYGDAKQSWCPQ
jgi:endonuclease YncB( thermonuclease family)